MTSPAAELRARPLVFVADLDLPVLDEADHHHLHRSLRLRTGDPITVADGAGGWRTARFPGQSSDRPELTGEVVVEAEPVAAATVGFAPVKGDRSDLVVQKLTELGVDKIVPLVTERSVVRWKADRAVKNLDRHRRIAREAAMQCRNPRLPTVEALTELAAFLNTHPSAVLADPAGQPLGGDVRTVAIGPEGGFAPGEIEDRTLGALPGRILRTETAAIVAGSIVTTHQPRFG